MSDLFHVFIERPRSPTPGAVAELARAIAARYGIPAAELESRLAIGRFRVKGNVDRTTADVFAEDLTRLGAVCTVAAASAAVPAAAAPPSSLPRVDRVAVPPAASPPRVDRVAVPSSQPRVDRVAAPAAAPPPSSQPRVDRVAASSAQPPQELGALSGEMPLTLSTIDGATEDEARASRKIKVPASFAPPDQSGERPASASRNHQLPASFGPPPEESPASASRNHQLPASFGPPPEESPASASRNHQLPASFGPAADEDDVDVALDDAADEVEVFDPFAPPEAQADAPELMLAVDRPSRKRPSQVVDVPLMPSSSHGGASSGHGSSGHGSSGHGSSGHDSSGHGSSGHGSSSHGATMAVSPYGAAPATPTRAARPPAPAWRRLLRDDVVRLIAGAVLAVALGALPALLIGGARERAAFAAIDTEVEKRQDEIKSREVWEGLDRVRATFAERKRAERQSVAMTSLLIWTVVGGGFAWLWYRQLDWDRILA